MIWCRQGDKPLSEPIRTWLPTHICGTKGRYVKVFRCNYHLSSSILPVNISMSLYWCLLLLYIVLILTWVNLHKNGKHSNHMIIKDKWPIFYVYKITNISMIYSVCVLDYDEIELINLLFWVQFQWIFCLQTNLLQYHPFMWASFGQ